MVHIDRVIDADQEVSPALESLRRTIEHIELKRVWWQTRWQREHDFNRAPKLLETQQPELRT